MRVGTRTRSLAIKHDGCRKGPQLDWFATKASRAATPVTDEPFKVAPVRIAGDPAHDGSDMLRADDAERGAPYDPKKAIRAGSEVIVQSFGL